jgi:hypothetical protein
MAGYLGNVKLKERGIKINFTPQQVQEYVRCSKDPVYFIKKFVKITNVDAGIINFDLYDYEQRVVETITKNRFVILKFPRQSGKSITVIAYLLWYILFNPYVSVALLNFKQKKAVELLGRLRLAYEFLPLWIQQGIIEWNKGNIELENGSKILADATSGPSVRGGSYNLVVLDEFAHVPNHIADDFFKSTFPTISSGKTTKMIIVSTPKGLNSFYKMWMDAIEKRSPFLPMDIHWSETPGRDEAWAKEQRNIFGEEGFEQEYGGEFLGSSNTLITGTKLRMLAFKNPLHAENGLKVYENPLADHRYVLCGDTAEGKQLDYSAFIVVDVTIAPYKIVAVYRSNIISPLLLPEVISNVGHRYNDAFVLIEMESVGRQVSESLHFDLEYDNILTTIMKGRNGQALSAGFAKNAQLGVKMTPPVKKTGCANLKTLIEMDQLVFVDFDIISELSTFVRDGKAFKADDGYNDDLVMCMVILSWLVSQKYYKEMMDNDIRNKLKGEQEMMLEHDMLPFGFIVDGQEEEGERISGDVWFPAGHMGDVY